MSLSKIASFDCGECGTTFKAKVWTSLNGTKNPELREDLFRNRLNITVCPNCGKEALVDSLLYHDQDREFMVWYKAPDSDREIQFQSEALEITSKLPNYNLRIVASRNALIEKIHTFENGLDDRVVELLKAIISSQVGDDSDPPSERFWFSGRADPNTEGASLDELVFVDIDADDDEAALFMSEAEHYKPAVEKFGVALSRVGGRGDGWCVVDEQFVERALTEAESNQDDCANAGHALDARRERLNLVLSQIGAVLTDYIEIHDQVFKFSLRRLVPIPGLFKSIDFGAHTHTLAACCHRLSSISADIKEDEWGLGKVDRGTLRQYCAALQDAAGRLRDICGRLGEKARGDRQYSAIEYKADLAEYETSRCAIPATR